MKITLILLPRQGRKEKCKIIVIFAKATVNVIYALDDSYV